MVIYEEIEKIEEIEDEVIVKAYSDQGMMIKGGFPEGVYAEAYDPKYLGRTYVETDIPIHPQEEVAGENE